jgi:hypothetical protein
VAGERAQEVTDKLTALRTPGFERPNEHRRCLSLGAPPTLSVKKSHAGGVAGAVTVQSVAVGVATLSRKPLEEGAEAGHRDGGVAAAYRADSALRATLTVAAGAARSTGTTSIYLRVQSLHASVCALSGRVPSQTLPSLPPHADQSEDVGVCYVQRIRGSGGASASQGRLAVRLAIPPREDDARVSTASPSPHEDACLSMHGHDTHTPRRLTPVAS